MSEGESVTVEFSPDELAEVRAALLDRRFETKQYLRSVTTNTGHDECCPTHIAKVAMMNEYRQGLTDRLAAVDTALERVGDPTTEESHE